VRDAGPALRRSLAHAVAAPRDGGWPALRRSGAVIFVTVGQQMPFDRMVAAVDAWAGRSGRRDLFAQIGPTALVPEHVAWTRFIDPGESRRHVSDADALVAHAGMGTILQALEFGKPILVMPRRHDLQETRNNHQVATAERFLALKRVHVAFDAEALA